MIDQYVEYSLFVLEIIYALRFISLKNDLISFNCILKKKSGFSFCVPFLLCFINNLLNILLRFGGQILENLNLKLLF